MTDAHTTFLKAICARPDDDLPRLIYADWLEENATPAGTKPCAACDGDGLSTGPPECRPCRRCNGAGEIGDGSGNAYAERSEFIRVQCELARIPVNKWGCRNCTSPAVINPAFTVEECCCKHKPRIHALRRRERELHGILYPGGRVWVIDGLRVSSATTDPGYLYYPEGLRPDDWCWVAFRRGFIEELTCSWSNCRAHLSAIRQRTPIRKVRLTDPPGVDHYFLQVSVNCREFWQCPKWPGIEFELPPRPESYQINWPGETVLAPAGTWTRG